MNVTQSSQVFMIELARLHLGVRLADPALRPGQLRG